MRCSRRWRRNSAMRELTQREALLAETMKEAMDLADAMRDMRESATREAAETMAQMKASSDAAVRGIAEAGDVVAGKIRDSGEAWMVNARTVSAEVRSGALLISGTSRRLATSALVLGAVAGAACGAVAGVVFG